MKLAPGARFLLRHLRYAGAAAVVAATVAACAATESPPEPTGSTSSALGITGLFPTGVDANGTPLANGAVDPHYTLTTIDPTLGAMPKAVAVPAQTSMGGAPAWTPNTASSKWISVRANATSALLIAYTYTTTFNLNGADPTTASLTGSLACDDTCVLRLNGTQIKNFPSPGWPQSTAFSVPAGSNFVAGQNTLSVVVTNSGGIVTGLQITSLTPGCTTDGQCASTQFCNTQTNACVPKIPDGSPVPTIGGHTPPLTGTCSTAVGTAVCVTGACNTTTNDCGAAAPPACTIDSQCAATQFCNTQTTTCTPKLPDGTPIPTLSGHTPPLAGACTTAAGTAVCVSGICDMTTNDCGAGPSTPCTADAQCTSAQFCDTQTSLCVPKIPDGAPIPTLPGHTPPLTGGCSVAVGTAVCVTGACNMTTNDCGAGPTTPTCTTDAQCASTAFCDTQTMLCVPKLPDGTPIPTLPGHAPPLTGMCTTAVGAAVCISAACDTTSNTCGSGCAMDSDCATTQFCNTQTMMCTPKLPNGDLVPTITGHTPALAGMCTTAVGASVCASAVCDMTDNECGFANGDGPCTAANGGVVCQSGACAANGTCAPGAACTMDSDCAATQFCNTQVGMCTAKLPNGTPIPTLTGHTPPLMALCTPDTGTAVCIAAVCDTTNNECGLANGGGPCTLANGAMVCQSGVCNAAGICGPGQMCAVDSDCTNPSAPDCDPTTHVCVPGVDGGAGDGGNAGDGGSASDGGAPDTGSDAGADAGHHGNADGGADTSGFVEGGGCSITASTSSSSPTRTAGALFGAALALTLARRRRAGAAPLP